MGYTLDDLIGLVQEVFTQAKLPDPTAIILLIAEELEPFLTEANSTNYQADGPDIKYLQEYLAGVLQTVDGLPSQLTEALKQSATEIVVGLGGQVSKLLLQKLLTVLVPGGGLVELVKRLVGMVTWFLDNRNQFETLWEDAKQSVKVAVEGGSDAQAKIAKRFEDGLAKLLPVLLSGSAKLLTGYTPEEFVKKAFMGVKNAAQKPARVVLMGIAKQLSKVFEQLLQRLLPSGAGSPPPLLAPIRFGSENEKRLWVASDGTVMVKASPNQTFANYLKTTNLSDTDKKKAEKLAQQISATAKSLAASTKSKQDRASLKQANELRTKIEGLEKELAKLLGVSADCAKVLVHSASSGCDPCSLRNPALTPGTAAWVYMTLSAPVPDRRDYTDTDNTNCLTMGPYPTATPTVITEAWALFDAMHPTIGTGTDTDIPARRWARCLVGVGEHDDAGHVIANKLGGSGAGPTNPLQANFNLFPQSLSLNRGVCRAREGRVRKAISSGARVCVHITLNYATPDFPGRPKQVVYDVWVDGQQNPTMPINFANPSATIPNPI